MALLNEEIAHAAKEQNESADKRIEHLNIIKSVNDRLSKHIEQSQKWEEKHRDDAIEVMQLLVKHSDSLCDKAKTIELVGKEQLLVRREMMKLDEVYYQIFPERLAQDVRFLDQLASLMSKPDGDAGSKKG